MNDTKLFEEVLHARRGWAVRQPRSECVVLLLTGGMDSSILAELCIVDLNTTIYPLYIRRGAKAQIFEEQAARKVVSYLKRKYGDAIQELYIVDAEIPPKAIGRGLNADYVINFGYPMRNNILEMFAVQYATMLTQQGVSTFSILVGSVADDVSYDNSYESLLMTTITVCVSMNDWRWQIIAPCLIPGLTRDGRSLTKRRLAQLGSRNKFPMHLTRSCTGGKAELCGVCSACIRRGEILEGKERI